MADFCRQCSLDNWGLDHQDLAGLNDARTLNVGEGFLALCEGCGTILVDHAGQCLGHCIEKHTRPNKFCSTAAEAERFLSFDGRQVSLTIPGYQRIGQAIVNAMGPMPTSEVGQKLFFMEDETLMDILDQLCQFTRRLGDDC